MKEYTLEYYQNKYNRIEINIINLHRVENDIEELKEVCWRNRITDEIELQGSNVYNCFAYLIAVQNTFIDLMIKANDPNKHLENKKYFYSYIVDELNSRRLVLDNKFLDQEPKLKLNMSKLKG